MNAAASSGFVPTVGQALNMSETTLSITNTISSIELPSVSNAGLWKTNVVFKAHLRLSWWHLCDIIRLTFSNLSKPLHSHKPYTIATWQCTTRLITDRWWDSSRRLSKYNWWICRYYIYFPKWKQKQRRKAWFIDGWQSSWRLMVFGLNVGWRVFFISTWLKSRVVSLLTWWIIAYIQVMFYVHGFLYLGI